MATRAFQKTKSGRPGSGPTFEAHLGKFKSRSKARKRSSVDLQFEDLTWRMTRERNAGRNLSIAQTSDGTHSLFAILFNQIHLKIWAIEPITLFDEGHMDNFELHVSWMMTTTIRVRANSESEASSYALKCMQRPIDGSFLPFSMNVDSIETVDGTEQSPGIKLFRVK